MSECPAIASSRPRRGTRTCFGPRSNDNLTSLSLSRPPTCWSFIFPVRYFCLEIQPSTMEPGTQAEIAGRIPVFLLKTKSSPGDSYEDLFNGHDHGYSFNPVFVPVLQHKLDEENLASVKSLLQQRGVSAGEDASFGGMIFTSQRAVEAFVKVVQDGQSGKHAYSRPLP